MNDEPKQEKEFSPGVSGRIGIAGTLTFRDKSGKIVQVMEIEGSAPLKDFMEQSNGITDR